MIRFLFIPLIFLPILGYSQDGYLKFKPYRPYKWMIAAGWNVVEDDGRAYSHHFDAEDAWNYLPYPTQLAFDRYLKKSFSLEATASYNEYGDRVLVNDSINRPGEFFSFGVSCKYSFLRFFEPRGFFDPYIAMGANLAYRSNNSEEFAPFLHFNIGVNFWVIERVGIRLQSSANFGFLPGIMEDNYLQHSAVIVYRHPFMEKRDDSFKNPKYKWVRKKPKNYKEGKTKTRKRGI